MALAGSPISSPRDRRRARGSGDSGIDTSPAVDPYEILRKRREAMHRGSSRALVIGGRIRGIGVARVLAARGVAVVLTEVGTELAVDIASRSRRFQTLALAEHASVTVHLRTTVEALTESTATLWNGDERWEVGNIDIVVPTRTLLPVTLVADELYARDDIPPVYLLGDCAEPRTALEALHDAAALAHRV
jgi:pyruvate/2-oxoglutarate dehydrogenase complex dihydrolipoamide dehydrogenase (E3) component